MILLVDIGNTRLKWAFLTQDEFEFGGALNYTEENFLSLLASIWTSISLPERVIIANVAGDKIANLLQRWINDHMRCRISFMVTKKEYLGLVNAYQYPNQFGVDRWMAMLAIWNEFDAGFCLVGCGTALTFDAVNNEGKHLGGLILPGIDLMKTALIEKLPGCRQPEPRNRAEGNLLANNTFDAITGGCLYTTVAFINHLTTDLIEEIGDNINFMITGGSAQKVLPLLQYDYQYRPHLVLEGLSLLA